MDTTCPLCSAENVAERYDPKSPIWIIPHLMEKHLNTDKNYKLNGVLCTCGKQFRGTRSWTCHILGLEGKDLAAHVIQDGFGAKASYFQKPRKWVASNLVEK